MFGAFPAMDEGCHKGVRQTLTTHWRCFMYAQITPLTNRATGPETRQVVRAVTRTALARLDRWTLETFNPVALVPRQRTR